MGNATNINYAIVDGIINSALSYPVKWAGVPLRQTPTIDQVWLEIHSFYSSPSQLGLKSLDRIKGFLQIDIYMPKNSGTELSFQITDEIRAALPVNFAGLEHNGVKVNFESVGAVGNVKAGEQWDKSMVEAHFYVYVDRNA